MREFTRSRDPMLSRLSRIRTIRGTGLIFKIDRLLNIDSKTVWHRWKRHQKFGLENGDVGKPGIFSEEQMRAVVDDVTAQFHAM
jgi:hypothetical protein